MIQKSLFLLFLFIGLLLSLADGQLLSNTDDMVTSPLTMNELEDTGLTKDTNLDEDDTQLSTDGDDSVDNEDQVDEADDEEVYDDDDLDTSTTYDIDQDPMDGGHYGLALNKNKDHQEEQGDELGEELFVEYDDDDDEDDEDDSDNEQDATSLAHNNQDDGTTGLLFEDDEEEPLDFKNNEHIDLDQLLFEASLKDTTQVDYTQQHHDPLDMNASHDDIDQLLANADDLLSQQQQEDGDNEDDEHPDHVNDTPLADSIFQPPTISPETAPLVPPPGIFAPVEPTPDNDLHTSHYKLPLFGILVLLGLLYKVSKKNQGTYSRNKFLEKEEKGLPLHSKDLTTPEADSAGLIPSPSQQLHAEGRRSSTTTTTRVATVGIGHTRRISLGHHPMHHYSTIKESKWEDEWQDEKRRL